jgi:hypothetical protein
MELASVSRERDTRVAESKQFQAMRGLMQRKNAQMGDLRARLAKYEPDAVGGEEE